MFVSPAFAQAETEELMTQEGVATEDHGSPGFPPFDGTYFPSQLLWLAIIFGLFYLFLQKVVLPRIASILEVRRDRIAQDLDQAARMKEEADEAVAAYEQELADARSKANDIAQEARDGAKAKAEAERRKVEAELDEKLKAAESRIAAIKADAIKEVGTIAEDTAGAIVRELIGTQPDKSTVSAAVRASGG